jgi:hypothetical protein
VAMAPVVEVAVNAELGLEKVMALAVMGPEA